MRHRTGGKHNPNYNTSSHDDAHSRSKLANATRRTNLHSGVWQRIIGIVISFTILMLLISSVGKGNRIVSTGGSSNGVRSGTTGNIIGVNKSKGNHGSTNPLFVTIVMPRYVCDLANLFDHLFLSLFRGVDFHVCSLQNEKYVRTFLVHNIILAKPRNLRATHVHQK